MNNKITFETNLEKFMKNIIIENKNLSKYEDNNGTMFELNTVQLMTRVDYMELTEKELEQLKFNMAIENKDYPSKEVTKLRSKYEETKKEEDRFTIIDTKIKVYQVWNVSNPYGAYKSFDNKEDALKLAKSINAKVKKYLD